MRGRRAGAHRWLSVPLLAAVAASAALGARTTPDALTAHQRILDDPAKLLRAARAAEERGDRSGAAALLAETSARHPVVADHADLLRARILLEGDDTSRAAVLLLETLKRHRRSPLRADFHQLLGDARMRFGDEPAARTAWETAYDETPSSEQRAALLAAIADSYDRSNLPEDSARAWVRVWTSYPTAEATLPAEERIDSFEADLDQSFRSASTWRKRADKLFRARHNAEALEAYEQALTLGLSGGEGRRAGLQRGYTLFRLRRYPDAVTAFEELPQDKDVRLWHARSLARADRVPEAVAELEALAKTRGELGVRSLYLAALLLDGRGHSDRARSYYGRVANSRSYGLATAALWRLGWSAYRAGEYAEAAGLLERLAERVGDPLDRLRPRYWRARALERQAKPTTVAAATAEYEAIALEFPLSYYGWRARGRIRPAERQPPEGAELREGRPALSGRELARPRILLEAGLTEEAARELGLLRQRAKGLDERIELAQLFTDAGNYNGAQRMIVGPYTHSLARGPVPSLEEVWWYAWPAAYANLVEGATAEPGSVDESLVYSIMREESGYRPRVLSISGARGLLQIMEPTGARLSEDRGRPSFHADELFEPRVNIDLGALYLTQLSHRFPGRMSAAIASYNAGASAVQGWVRERGGYDDDEWVEAIPYDQTRTYVKRVMRSLHAYRVLY